MRQPSPSAAQAVGLLFFEELFAYTEVVGSELDLDALDVVEVSARPENAAVIARLYQQIRQYALAATVAAPALKSDDQVELFRAGDEEILCFRIPMIVALPNSSVLLAFSEARNWIGDGCYPSGVKPGNNSGNTRHTSIVYKSSTSGGRTWSAAMTNLTQVRLFLFMSVTFNRKWRISSLFVHSMAK